MRKNQAKKRSVLPDPIFNSKLVTKTINAIMHGGKKGTAQKILYKAFNAIKTKTKEDPFEVFKKAIENITPQMELKVRRVGGANYQVPIEVREDRKQVLALRWLIKYARLRSEKTMIERLTNEIIDSSKNSSGSVKKKQDTHKMAEANKAFAHFRF